MADWRKYKNRVHEIENKINFIDPNDLLLSNEYIDEESGLYTTGIYNDLKNFSDKIRHTWAPEDYCIDVDICMEVSSRGDYAQSMNDIFLLNWDGKSGHISLQSGQRFYRGENHKTDNYAIQKSMEIGQQSEDRAYINYMSSRDAEVNFQDIMTDYLSTEMLGINSIKIEYTNNFCPKVTLEMTDVRGIGVMSPLERSHTKIVNGVSGYDRNDIAGSFYRALFNLPYPKVTMKVKGLYGAPATYDLTFADIKNNFDSKTGNFKITLVLMGYYYSFLTQVPVMHALLSPYFHLFGADYWENTICSNPAYSLDGATPITWIELVKRVSNAKIKIEQEKADVWNNPITGDLTVAKKSALNTGLMKACGDASELLDKCYQAYIKDIESAFKYDERLTVNGKPQVRVVGFIDESNPLMGLCLTYTSLIDEDGISMEACREHRGYFANVPDSEMQLPDVYKLFEEKVNQAKTAISRLGGFNQYSLNIEDFYRSRSILQSNWNTVLNKAQNYSVVRNMIPDNISAVDTRYAPLLDYKSLAIVSLCSTSNDEKVPLFKTLVTLRDIAKQSVQDLDSLEKAEVTRILNDSLGFYPSVKNVVKLIIEHCECYFHTLYSLTSAIGLQSMNGKRDVSKLGLKQSESDFRLSTVPPFPEITEIQDNRRVKSWTGAMPAGNLFLETGYINSVVKASNDCIDKLNDAINGRGDTSTGAFRMEYNEGNNQSNDNLNRMNMLIPLSYSDIMSGGRSFQELDEQDISSFVNDGNMSAILTVVYMRMLQFLQGHPMSRSNLTEQNFSNLGKADAYNFFNQFYRHIDTAFVQKLQEVVSKGDFVGLMLKELSGDANKNFDSNEEKITDFYQQNKGYDSDSLINGTMYCIPSNNVDNTNDIEYVCQHNKPESDISRVDNLKVRSVIGLYDSTDENIPVEQAVYNDNFRNYGNYLMIDRTGKFVCGFGEKQGDYDNIFSTYGVTSVDTQFNDIFNAYEEDSSDFCAVPALMNAGVSKAVNADNLHSSKDDFEDTCPMSIPTPLVLDGEDGTNLLASACYFGTLKRSVYERASLFVAGPSHVEGFKAGDTEWRYNANRFLNALSKVKQGRAKVSNGFLLSLGAIAWAHFFNEDNLYTIDWSFASAFHNRYVVLEDDKDEDIDKEYNTLDGKVTIAKAPVCNYDRVAYTLALYFMEWAENTFADIENTFSMEFKGLYQRVSTVNDLVTFLVDSDTYTNYGFSDITGDGFLLVLPENVRTMASESLCCQVSTFCYLPVSDKRYGNQERLNYLKSFFLQLYKIADEDVNTVRQPATSTQISQVPTATGPKDPKISIYQATKRLWDSWLCGARQRETDSFVIKNWLDIDFFNERFHFIDTFYNDISDTCIVNAKILSDTFIDSCGQQQGWSLMSFISKIMSQAGIAFYNIQNWANLCDGNTLAKAFVPMSYYESRNLDDKNSKLENSATNSDFVFIYRYEPSHTVGTSLDADKNAVAGDGFMIDVNDNLRDLPPEMGYNMKGQWKIPAFAVAYGKQYQSYFSDIQVNTKTGTMTEWGIQALMNLAKLGSDKITDNTQYMGQDLYTVQSNQSFTVTVTMLGCCWVQPFMYFVLTNVPMYRGTYMVYKVEHLIQAGKMTTTFSGYKMSRYANRLVDEPMYSHIPNVYSDKYGFTSDNKTADVDNECAYKVFPIEMSGASNENTTAGMSTPNTASSTSGIGDKLYDALKKTVAHTTVFDGYTLKKVYSKDDILVVSLANSSGDLDKLHNSAVFDMIVQAPDNGKERGYYGKFKRVSWVTKTLCQTNPDYIVIDASATDVSIPKIYIHHNNDAQINWADDAVIEDMFVSNCVDPNKNETQLTALVDSIPLNLWKIMGKNVAPDTDYKNDRFALAFSFMFGGTDFYEKKWGEPNKASTIAYKLSTIKAKACKDVLPVVAETRVANCRFPLINGARTYSASFNTNTQPFFSVTSPDYMARTLYGSNTVKLPVDVSWNPAEQSFGLFSDSRNVTSHWAICRDTMGVYGRGLTCRPHCGTDFSGYNKQGNQSMCKASYDGVILCGLPYCPQSSGSLGWGCMVYIAYNVQFAVRSKGSSASSDRTLVCCYCHIDKDEYERFWRTHTVGQAVHKGEDLFLTGSNGSSKTVGRHLHLNFLLVESSIFDDGERINNLVNTRLLSNPRDIIQDSEYNRDCFDYLRFPDNYRIAWRRDGYYFNDGGRRDQCKSLPRWGLYPDRG